MHYLHVATATLIIFTIALILGRQKQLADMILICWLAIFFSNVATYFILETQPQSIHTLENILFDFSDASVFVHGPVFWFYTCALTRPGFRFQLRHLPHFIPFLLFFILMLSEQVYNHSNIYLTVKLVSMVKLISMLAYILSVILLLLKYRRHVEDIFSNAEKKYLDWLWLLSLGMLVLWIVGFISVLMRWFDTASQPLGDRPMLKISIDCFIVVMSYFGFRQRAIFQSLNQPVLVLKELGNIEDMIRPIPDTSKETSPKYVKSGLSSNRSKEIHDALLKVMESDKPYMDEELTLFGLAAIMKVPPNHLSQVINMYEQRNFFDFINFYRVEEIKKIIHADTFKNFSLLGIAFECGFNSKAAFNRAFKKFTGQTPSAFKKTNE